jgi:hypothetical protein
LVDDQGVALSLALNHVACDVVGSTPFDPFLSRDSRPVTAAAVPSPPRLYPGPLSSPSH